MITGRLRGLLVTARALRAPRAMVSRLPMRVRITDTDLNRHLTNSRYPQLMDLGRLDLLIRSGVGQTMHRAGVSPMLVESTILFKRDLPFGTRFVLETRAVGRERKAVVFEQRFMVGERVHGLGTVKVVLIKDHQVIEPALLESLIAADDHVQGSALRSAQ